MGPIARTICFILALLTVLSIAPALLLACACTFAPSCLTRELGRFLVSPSGIRPVSLLILVAPLFVLLTYVLAFVRCYRRRDVHERSVALLAERCGD